MNDKTESLVDDEQALPEMLPIPKLDRKLLQNAVTARAEALLIKVETPEQSIEAQRVRGELQTSIKALADQRMSVTRPLDAVKAIIVSWFAAPILAREQARDHLDREIVLFNEKMEDQAREAQRKLDEAAEKERVRLAKLGDKAEARGDTSKAEVFRDRSDAVVAPVVAAALPKASGSALVKRWTYEIVDASKVNPLYVQPDLAKIGKQVRALGKESQKLLGDGVRVYQETGVSSRSTSTKGAW